MTESLASHASAQECLVLIGLFLSTTLLTAGATIPFSVYLARRTGAIDMPGEFKIHLAPVARLGGVGILAGFAGALFAAWLLYGRPSARPAHTALIFALAAIAIVGLVDDIRGVKELTKLLLELGVAIALTLALEIEYWWTAPLAWLWIVININGSNFLDGIDGLGASCAITSLVALSALHWLSSNPGPAIISAVLAFSTLGFLIHNWPKASVFMGDVGSLSLGLMTGSLSLLLVTHNNFSLPSLLAAILTTALAVGDVCLTFLRRLVNRKPLFPSDRGHFFDQMINKGGLSSRKTLYRTTALASVLGVLAVTTFLVPRQLVFLVFVAALVLVIWFAAKHHISLYWER